MPQPKTQRSSRALAGLAAILVLAAACKGQSLVPPAAPPEPPDANEVTELVLAEATFEGANGYHTAGGASLERTVEGDVLRLSDDFETDRSFALDIRLCRQRDCGDGDLVLGALQSFRGAQSYPIPGDGESYDFVVIWCSAVDLPFGHGRLQ